jgi:hypothetical protein
MASGKIFAAVAVLLAGLGAAPAQAGFPSPESLIRNVYAYYGDGAPGFSKGLPGDTDTAPQFKH